MMGNTIPMLVTIEDEDRKEAAELIERLRYMPDSKAQAAAVAHALAMARRRERVRCTVQDQPKQRPGPR